LSPDQLTDETESDTTVSVLDAEEISMTPSASQVLKIFGEMGRNELDLHVLFESAGNEPDGRRLVLDAVEELKTAGLLESRGGDFYSLTDNGKQELTKLMESSSSSS
jgi:hypothetical protein